MIKIGSLIKEGWADNGAIGIIVKNISEDDIYPGYDKGWIVYFFDSNIFMPIGFDAMEKFYKVLS